MPPWNLKLIWVLWNGENLPNSNIFTLLPELFKGNPNKEYRNVEVGVFLFHFFFSGIRCCGSRCIAEKGSRLHHRWKKIWAQCSCVLKSERRFYLGLPDREFHIMEKSLIKSSSDETSWHLQWCVSLCTGQTDFSSSIFFASWNVLRI